MIPARLFDTDLIVHRRRLFRPLPEQIFALDHHSHTGPPVRLGLCVRPQDIVVAQSRCQIGIRRIFKRILRPYRDPAALCRKISLPEQVKHILVSLRVRQIFSLSKPRLLYLVAPDIQPVRFPERCVRIQYR